MIMVLALLGFITGCVVLARRRGLSGAHTSRVAGEPPLRRTGDGPEWIVAVAGGLLPASRFEWGPAMAAELMAIEGRARRWRFAVDVVGVVLVPPGHRLRTVLVAGGTLVAAVIGTAAAAELVPELRVFAAVLGCLLTIVLACIALRWTRPGLAPLLTAVLVVVGVAATIATVVAVTVAHPAAASDPSHAFAILYAVVLCVYVALAAATPRVGTGALWWGLCGAGVSSVVWLALLPSHGTIEGLGLYLWPVGGAGALIASIPAAVRSHTLLAGAPAALTAAIISGPVFFTADIVRVLTLHQYVLTSPYDIAQYPSSGFPDVASFVLNDTLGGGVISVLVMYPFVLTAVGVLGGLIGSGLRRLSDRTASTTT
jgi:hypothetical protein